MAHVKQDSKASVLDEAVMTVIRKYPDGISDEKLQKEMPNLSPTDRAQTINRLVDNNRILLLVLGNQMAMYKEITEAEAAKTKGLNPEDVLVYQTIKNAHNKGIWTKDLRQRTNLPQPHINKALRTLETRNLIKSVKSVNNPNRKVYMLFELEPSRDLTGGAWYTENQLDATFIEVLRDSCLKYIRREKDTTIKEVYKFIATRQLSKVALREEDIHAIVLTLFYDCLVDFMESEDPDDEEEHIKPIYKDPQAALQGAEGMMCVPCGVCPVFNQCRDGGVISPATCEYYNKWLDF